VWALHARHIIHPTKNGFFFFPEKRARNWRTTIHLPGGENKREKGDKKKKRKKRISIPATEPAPGFERRKSSREGWFCVLACVTPIE